MFLFSIIRNLLCFTGSYSNDVFLEPLSLDEEDLCIKKKMMGDIDSRNKLIEHNLRLVAHIVKKFDNNSSLNDDLISIGTIGLIKGVDTFSPDKGVRITTYCARCIENEILMYFRKNNKYNNDISINAVHFGPLTYQVWGRNEKGTASHPERRYVMQVKWGSITDDLKKIRS